MKKLLIICAILSLSGCEVIKKATKSKKDIQSTETIKTQIKRVGDTLRIEIPKVTYKDTTIVKTNYVNRTEARIRYDSRGNADVECISAEMDEFREEVRTIIDRSKDKESEKTEELKASTLLYLFGGLALFVVIVGFSGLYILKKQLPLKNTN